MCVSNNDCDLHQKVDKILEDQKKLLDDQKDLRKDFDNMNKLVNTHNDIITKIDTKVQEGVYIGVDKALKGLDERVGSIVKREIKDNEYERLKAEKERKKGFMDHGIKQVIGIVIAGVIGFVVITFQLVNNNELKDQITETQSELREQIKLVQGQKDLLQEYEKIIEELKKK